MSQTLKQAFAPIIDTIRTNATKKAKYNISDIDPESIEQEHLDEILDISLSSNSKYKNIPFASLINLTEQLYRNIIIDNRYDKTKLEATTIKTRMLLTTVKAYIDSGKSTRDFNSDEAYKSVLRSQMIADVNLNGRYDYSEKVYSFAQIRELNLNNLGWYRINHIKLELANERFLYEADTDNYSNALINNVRAAVYKWDDITEKQQASLLSKTLAFANEEMQGTNLVENLEILLEPLEKIAPHILKELKLLSSLGINIGDWTRNECLSCIKSKFNAQTIPFEV